MRHVLDAAKVRRYATISRVLSFGGMGIMGIGLVVSFRQSTRLDGVLGLFLAGMIASQLGIPMRNRWDRRPRIDELLDRALKGLDGRFSIFHYSLGASHAVIDRISGHLLARAGRPVVHVLAGQRQPRVGAE